MNVAVLLSKTLLQYTRDWEDVDSGPAPSLLYWSNFHRPVGETGVRLTDGHRTARVSRRVFRQALTNARIFRVDPGEGGRGQQVVHLTDDGRRLLQNGRARFTVVDEAWRERFGSSVIENVERALEDFVGELPLELPHYPNPYGTVDQRITGGRAVPASDGPPPVPAHGRDWPVVPRDGAASASELPLSALLSQALVAFIIDYEATGVAWSAADGQRVEAVERGWRDRYGNGRVDALDATLHEIAGQVDPSLPELLLVAFVGGHGFTVVT